MKSSTESELVGLAEYLPYPLWMANFLELQGYKLKSNRIYQDNQSAPRMEKMAGILAQAIQGTFTFVISL